MTTTSSFLCPPSWLWQRWIGRSPIRRTRRTTGHSVRDKNHHIPCTSAEPFCVHQQTFRWLHGYASASEKSSIDAVCRTCPESSSNRHQKPWLKPATWLGLQHIVDVLVDGINLSADSVNGIAKGSLSRIVLTDGRLQFKCGIDEGVGCLINVLTQPQIRNL